MPEITQLIQLLTNSTPSKLQQVKSQLQDKLDVINLQNARENNTDNLGDSEKLGLSILKGVEMRFKRLVDTDTPENVKSHIKETILRCFAEDARISLPLPDGRRGSLMPIKQYLNNLIRNPSLLKDKEFNLQVDRNQRQIGPEYEEVLGDRTYKITFKGLTLIEKPQNHQNIDTLKSNKMLIKEGKVQDRSGKIYEVDKITKF
jgi:hypothetical protein